MENDRKYIDRYINSLGIGSLMILVLFVVFIFQIIDTFVYIKTGTIKSISTYETMFLSLTINICIAIGEGSAKKINLKNKAKNIDNIGIIYVSLVLGLISYFTIHFNLYIAVVLNLINIIVCIVNTKNSFTVETMRYIRKNAK